MIQSLTKKIYYVAIECGVSFFGIFGSLGNCLWHVNGVNVLNECLLFNWSTNYFFQELKRLILCLRVWFLLIMINFIEAT